MQIVFVHQNFPAQFGHVARFLAERHGHACYFVSRKRLADSPWIRHVRYEVGGQGNKHNHFCSRSFESTIWHSHGVFEALARRKDIRPDLIVGHSGFGSTLFLPEIYACPIINYFEYFYRPHDSDIDFRPDFPCRRPNDMLRSRVRNAMILLDLDNCSRGYSPTRWQHARLPAEYRSKVEVLFDGVDTRLWKPSVPADRKVGGWTVPRGCRLVTYATRGMESMRGFDVFMNVAHRLSKERSDVVFAIAGADRIAYGSDRRHTGGKSLKEYLGSFINFDQSRFRFLGLLPPAELAKLLSLSDLHFYLTVPFVLSWSLFDALACEATVLASDTAPVREVVTHEKNGLLVNFFDEDEFLATALQVLRDPQSFRRLGREGRLLVQEHYGCDVCLPRLQQFYETVAGSR